MPLQKWFNRSEPQPGAPGLRALTVLPDQWREVAQDCAAAGGRLVALWASADERGTAVVRAALLSEKAGLLLSAPIAHPKSTYPGVGDLFPAAVRMQRAISDLTGLRSSDPDTRPWLRHAGWPQDYRPLIDAPLAKPVPEAIADGYAFVRVDGEGVHEIAVGPVHAGIIEPGHFRFSVVGEKVLRLEERLAYVHKGIEQRFTQLPIFEAYRLAARVSGDSAVAYSWAFCQALEGMAGVEITSRAAWLRGLFLELERVANHLGDLGALGNDAGFAFGLTQFSRLKETLLRAAHDALGARYLLDAIVPGGTRQDLARDGALSLRRCLCEIAHEVQTLRLIYDEHEGLRDRFNGAGTVAPELAARLGLTGLAGRASGQAFDLRCDLPCEPYPELSVRKIGRIEGDVAARVAVRFDELQESCRLVERILEQLPEGASHAGARARGGGAWCGPD